MKMTKKIALNVALSNCGADNYVFDGETVSGEEVRETITKMIEQLSIRREGSEDARAKAAQKKKDATAKARAELLEKVAPVLRANLSEPVTAKKLFEICKTDLPEDFSWNKVQHILIHEMKTGTGNHGAQEGRQYLPD